MKKSLFTLLMTSVTILSYAQLSWLQLPDVPGPVKRGVSSFSINGKGYMGLGLLSSGAGTSDWFEYDPGLNTWTQKASLPAAGRFGCASFAIGNKGYIVTGSNGTFDLNEVWEYDPALDTWTAKTNYPGGARESATGFSIGNKGYVGTGYTGGNSFTDFYEFDPVANTWTAKTPFIGPARNGACSFCVGSKGYLGLGNNTNSTSNFKDFYLYDPATDSWSQKADFPIPYVVEPCSYSSVSNGYVLCGYYYQSIGITHNPLNMFYKYDPTGDAWTLAGTFPGLPRGYAGGFGISNDIYIGCGGQTNTLTTLLSDFWKLSNGLTLSVPGETGRNNVDFIMYPDPAHNFIYVSTKLAGQKFEHIRLYDVMGRLISNKSIKDNSEMIDVSSFKPGIYFVELVTNKGEVLDSKFVKE